MGQILILLVMLAGATHVAETTCRDTHNTSLCIVAPGESVYVQVLSNASGLQVWCKKQLPSEIKLFTLKKEKLTVHEAFRNRTEFFINNGTFKIGAIERNDSGQYIVEVFDPNGILVKTLHIQLDVQENTYLLWILVSAGVGILLLILVWTVLCCVHCKNKKKKKKKKEKKKKKKKKKEKKKSDSSYWE